MSSSAANIKTNPRYVYWMIEAQECFDFSSVSASVLGGQYVSLYTPNGSGFYTFFDENNTDVDPAPGGLTLINVDYAAAATAGAIATAFQAAVDGAAGFSAAFVPGSTTIVRVTRDAVGSVTPSAGTAASVAVTIEKKGKNVDLGLTEGDIESPSSPATLTITAQQFGLTPVAIVGTGFEELEVEITLLETQASKLKEFYSIYGGSFTPGGGTEIFGMGTAFLGKAMLTESARLVLRPVNATNALEDLVYLAAVPVPSTFTISGENPQKLSLTFKCVVDTTFNSVSNMIAFGDVFQAGL